MNKSNTQQLILDHPALFRYARAGTRQPIMYGCECGDGWFPIVYLLCMKMEERARAAGLDPKSDKWPAIAQLKEKFGHMRIYIENQTRIKLDDLTSEATESSKVTCELCGKPGVLRCGQNEWMTVRCDACEKKHQKSRLLEKLLWWVSNRGWSSSKMARVELLERRARVEYEREKARRYDVKAAIAEAFARVDAYEMLKNPLVAAVAKGLAEYDSLEMESADVKAFWKSHGITNVLEVESEKLSSLLLLLKCPAHLVGRYDDKQFVEAKRLAELVRFDLLERLTVKIERGELVLNLSEIANASDVVEKSYL